MATLVDSFASALAKARTQEVSKLRQMRHNSQSSDNINADSSNLYELVAPHVESFNWMFEKDDGLERIVKNLPVLTIDPSEHGVEGFPKVSFFLESVHIGKPTMAAGIDGEVRMLPHTAREYGASYDAPLKLNLSLQIGDSGWQTLTRTSGRLPIMVRSGRCHLQGLTRAEMVKHREEAGEWGGYFILNGNERLVRLIVMPRRNHIFAMERSSFLKRGPEYTRFATSIRCVRLDQSASTVNVHYLETGCVNVRFSIRKQEFFIPAVLILKALTGMTDREIYERITQNDAVASFVAERAELMIREAKPLKLKSRADVLAYLGRHFRMLLRAERTDSDVKVGEDLLREYLFIHVQDFVAPGPNGEAVSELAINAAKAELLIVMMQRLFLLVQEKIKPDNVDAMSAHEALLPGYLYAMILKEALYDWLHGVRGSIIRDIRRQPKKVRLADTAYWRKTCDMVPEIGRKIKYFLVTGNLVSKTGLDLMQVSGYTISAEKLNYYRYLSHFRSVHRGQFFTTMKTTAVRKLLPESWGFMCPVHTPDGSPCGLLNHMSASCAILTRPCPIPSTELVNVLFLLGMSEVRTLPNPALIPVFLDGIVVGRVAATEAQTFCAKLRYLKITNSPAVYEYLEIFLVSDLDDKMWPAVCLSTAAARFVRPVYYLPTTQVPKPVVEYIGAMEQLTMEIACTAEDFMPGMTTHQEITPTNILSVIASLTPFSDHNQSPRNMYQCQMGKQTMGTPFHSYPFRVDNKVYRIQNPQIPIVRNEGPQQKYLFDEYPMGCNAVVAVISYTGYDMEDAMIINKFAYERGFGHGSVYKYKVIDLGEKRARGEPIHDRFNNRVHSKIVNGKPVIEPFSNLLDLDGLPRVGQFVQPSEPLAAYHNDVSQTHRVEKFADTEPAYVEEVRALGSADTGGEVQKVGLKLRMNRNPVIGDKFSSRHGQKGVLSVLYPHQDMPWTESGMTPDVIINPHAFPSRMTIGMLIESMAGKAGALHGQFQDGTPFQFNEKNKAVDHFGEQLRAAGYNYLGSEPLYSGIAGEPLIADIFVGVVFYQRLRHMVKDKFQARATGPVNAVTRQPIKGRKVHGGIRFGEMERDSLIAHGVSFLLHDRLMNSSDYHTTYVCESCGSILAAHAVPTFAPSAALAAQKRTVGTSAQAGAGASSTSAAAAGGGGAGEKTTQSEAADKIVTCRICGTGARCSVIAIPFVFLYLINELAAMNIRLTLDVK